MYRSNFQVNCIFLHAGTYLIQVFSSKKCLIATHRLENHWKSIWFLNLLPGFAAAISFQSVIDYMVIMWIFPCQDAGSTRAAQCTGYKLETKIKSMKKQSSMLSETVATGLNVFNVFSVYIWYAIELKQPLTLFIKTLTKILLWPFYWQGAEAKKPKQPDKLLLSNNHHTHALAILL